MNRREFLQQSSLAVGSVAALQLAGGCNNAPVSSTAVNPKPASGHLAIVVNLRPNAEVKWQDPAVPSWGISRIQEAAHARGLKVTTAINLHDVVPDAMCILIDTIEATKAPQSAEQLSVRSASFEGRRTLVVRAIDTRGFNYALTDLADEIASADDPIASLSADRNIEEQPANRIRGVGRLFCSDIEDKPWFNDKGWWQRYLTMLVSNRFNRFHLGLGLGYDTSHNILDSYFYFPYPFLLAVPGYDVKAVGLPDAERDNNLAMIKFIGDECAARGIDFQLGLWGHQYVFEASPNVNYPITGLTKETHATYCRDALALVLKACPNVSGLTFRIHGESGIAEGSYDFWKTVFDGIVRSGRKVPIEMHAKGSDQQIIDIAAATGMPVVLAPKTWSEHTGLPYAQTDIRSLEKPKADRKDQGFFATSNGSRSFTRYGYADLLTEGRKYQVIHRMWPGTQRHLLWGDPVFAAAYSDMSHFCDMDGHELFEPLTFKGRMGAGIAGGRQAYADESLKTADDFEKYRYYYVLYGRHLYNRETKPDVWQRQLRRDYGNAAPAVEAALAAASRILPTVTTAHSQSASYTGYWVELSWNMSILDPARKHPYSDTPSPKKFGKVTPLDPQIFVGIDHHVEQLVKNEPSGKYNPAEVAQRLEHLAKTALAKLSEASETADKSSPTYRRMALDVSLQAGMGMYFAEKMRAAMLWALHEQTGDAASAVQAVERYRAARKAWADAAELATGKYAKNISYGPAYFQKGHWSERIESIDADIADMEKRAADAKSGNDKVSACIAPILNPPVRPAIAVSHEPRTEFKRGGDVAILLRLAAAPPSHPTLHYRHVNQAENWQQVEMTPDAKDPLSLLAAIPAAYSDSAYPLQYYFELRDASGQAVLWPGLNSEWANQPYYVMRQSSTQAAQG